MEMTTKFTPRRLTKHEVAERIAKALFVNAFGARADHMRLYEGDGCHEQYIGGWGYKLAVDHIEKILSDCLE